MPKMRSHSGARKRFRRTASGLWKHKKAASRHLLTPSRSKRGRLARRPGSLTLPQGVDRQIMAFVICSETLVDEPACPQQWP